MLPFVSAKPEAIQCENLKVLFYIYVIMHFIALALDCSPTQKSRLFWVPGSGATCTTLIMTRTLAMTIRGSFCYNSNDDS